MASSDVPLRDYLDSKFKEVESRFDRIEASLEKVEGLKVRVALIEDRMQSAKAQFGAIWGLMVTLLGSSFVWILTKLF